MRIKLNGEDKIIEERKNILDIISEYKLNLNTIVVEYNLNILDKNEYDKTFVKDGDQIEIVRFMGGG